LLLLDQGESLSSLVEALNALGVTPRDLVTILQSLRAAGALEAEITLL
jgi:flagellar P-ring protein precursor FlgI